MSKQLLFKRKKSSAKKVSNFISLNNLDVAYSNRNETVWENNDMIINSSKYVLRILIYNESDTTLINDVKKFFYGEKYEKNR